MYIQKRCGSVFERVRVWIAVCQERNKKETEKIKRKIKDEKRWVKGQKEIESKERGKGSKSGMWKCQGGQEGK